MFKNIIKLWALIIKIAIILILTITTPFTTLGFEMNNEADVLSNINCHKAIKLLKTHLINWAIKNKIKLASNDYVEKLEVNLFNNSISQQSLNNFLQAKGNETKIKMLALWSSSALVVNFFEYWKANNPSEISKLFQSDSLISINYENPHPTGLKGTAPHLDIEFTYVSKSVAIESKFLEPYSNYKNKNRFSKSYFSKDEIWKNLPKCKALANEINNNHSMFKHLDAAQLLKHIIGLNRCYGKNGFKLVYLWYYLPCKESNQHKNEITIFTNYISKEIIFESITYQDLFLKIRTIKNINENYIYYIENRYFSNSLYSHLKKEE